MRCYFLLAVSVVALVKAQYDQPPEPEGAQGNPYYDHEAPPAYEGQEGDVDKQAYPRGPPRGFDQGPGPQGQERPYDRRPPPAPVGGVGNRKAANVAVENGTFTLPAYYHSITTTERVVRVNRRNYPQMIDALISK